MLRRLLMAFFAAAALASTAEAEMVCFMQYLRSDSHCWEVTGGWRCDVFPVYDVVCTDVYDVTGLYPKVPPIIIPPGEVGTRENPYIMDPSVMYVLKVTDADPNDVHVWVAADSRLSLFKLYMNGTEYGSAFGSGTVAIGGLSASSFCDSSTTLDVIGCGSSDAQCAAAFTRTVAYSGYANNSAPILGGFVDAGPQEMSRSVVLRYGDRTYDVPFGPGNSRIKLGTVSTSLTWNDGPPGNYSASRDESLEYKVTVGANEIVRTCQPQNVYAASSPDGGTISPAGTQTEWRECTMEPLIGGTASVTSHYSTLQLWHNYYGRYLNTYVVGEILSLSIP